MSPAHHPEHPGAAAIDRRTFVRGALLLPAVAVVGACGERDESIAAPSTGATAATPDATGARLAATPACDDGDDDPTPSQTEGPYFTPDSPRRRSLLTPGMPGTRLVVTGRVLTTDCRPVRRAVLDFWQADAAGAYDNEGFRLRGHQLTDAQGRYRLETIVPGLYPGRTRHIHVKVARPGSTGVLTTQLYFPGEARNRSDGIFDPALLMAVRRSGRRRAARFDFVL